LESYLSHIVPTTLLVFAYKYKKLVKRTKLFKAILEKSVVFESDKLREDKVPSWILEYMKEKKFQVDQKAATLLVDFLGNDLGRIIMELDKLMLVVPAGSNQITSALIEKNIGISKDFNNFELIRALVNRDALKSNRIALYFANNPKNNPFILTISSLFYYFSKVLIYHSLADKSRENVARELGINSYFANEYQQAARVFPPEKTRLIISYLREYDMKDRGYSTASASDLLKELIYKILH
jgi:DNA polymerase-3 subunit delta